MHQVAWSLEAFRILSALPGPVQEDIAKKTRLLERFPLMHPRRRRGRYRGQRYFVSHDWLVYYLVEAGTVFITTIGHGRRRRA